VSLVRIPRDKDPSTRRSRAALAMDIRSRLAGPAVVIC
jgi:hypothetical protein